MKKKLILLAIGVMLIIGGILVYFLNLFAQAIGNSDRMHYLIVAADKVYGKERIITEELINKYVARDRPDLKFINGSVMDRYGGGIRIYISETTNFFDIKVVSSGRDRIFFTDDDEVVERSILK